MNKEKMTDCSKETCNCTFLTRGNDTSPHLLRYAVIHCSTVLAFGTICNLVALWCVWTCTRTRPPVKILLCSMLATTLIMCVIVMPLGIEVVLSELLCDPARISLGVLVGLILLYTVLVQMEQFYIAAMAFFRAVAVWCPQRHTVRLRTAVVMVVAIGIYSVVTTMGVIGPIMLHYVTDPKTKSAMRLLYCFLHTLLPILFTISCYCSMMIAVWRNKRRLSSIQHNTKDSSQVIDQATRAMLAVFISNLVLALPHSVYHIFDVESFTLYIIIHVIFFLHIVVDPFVFVWFNLHHRQRVAEKVQSSLNKIKCLAPISTSTFESPSTTQIDQ